MYKKYKNKKRYILNKISIFKIQKLYININ